ncbi:Dabb family protein [Hahella ganghwensis]|uniref:Dabb family protein n=1 Tax=Hahella ganghwensis TaxID=286420 RepID=UPI00037B78A3|nr:Dabb family protein [Hahella ganghwensis]
MIQHIVLFKIASSATAEQISHMDRSLAALCQSIDGLLSYSGGPNNSPEQIERGYNFGFVMSFTDREARDNYLPHPEHEKVKQIIGGLLLDTEDNVLVYDYEFQDS